MRFLRYRITCRIFKFLINLIKNIPKDKKLFLGIKSGDAENTNIKNH